MEQQEPKKLRGLAAMTPEQRAANLEKGRITRATNKALGITVPKKKSPMRAIKAKCQDCMAGSKAEVRRCDTKDCPLWQYRCKRPNDMGKPPEFDEEGQEIGADAAEAAEAADESEDVEGEVEAEEKE